MTFVIWWGKHYRRVPRGVVLDVCPACRQITPSFVFDHFTQDHLYGVGYGSGTYHGATRDCRQCRRSYALDEAAYDDIMAVSAVSSAPDAFERLLRGTNSRLASILDIGNRVRASAKQPPYRGPAGESAELPLEALDHLEKLLLAGYAVQPLFEKLGGWDALTDEERKDLVETLRSKTSPREATPAL